MDPGPVAVQSARLQPDGPHATFTLVLRWELDEAKEAPFDQTLTFELPSGRVALEEAAVHKAGEPWSEAGLLEGKEAERRFDTFVEELFVGGEGKEHKQRPALLITAHPERGEIDVRLGAHEATGAVEVRLRWRLFGALENGAWTAPLPRAVSDRRLPTRVLGPGQGSALRHLDDETLLSWPAGPKPQRWGGSFASAAVGGQVVYRVEAVAGAELGTHRRPTWTVFVLDASKSFGAERHKIALGLIDEMLKEMTPGSRWALLTFDRRSRVRVSPGTPAEDRRPLRRLRTFHGANGSELAQALRRAHVLADDADPELDPRIVVLSDLRTRQEL
ncbi:MAG: VWA domain-containing protein, partial [Gemmatimonadetes bacterium]